MNGQKQSAPKGSGKIYKVGDLIIYGNTGVCRIEDVAALDAQGTGHEQLFYVLTPLYQNCTIYAPVHNTKIFMRPIITKEEAERLIEEMPSIRAEAYHTRSVSQLAELYKESLKTHECSDLIELCVSLYTKKQDAEQQNRKFGALDEKYMKRAEELLFGELAAALGIEKDRVPAYIAAKATGELE
jgi:CarD family transcriptional regulator